MKRRLFVISALFLLIIAAPLTLAQEATEEPAVPFFDGARAYEHVANHVAVGSRATATAGSIEAGNIILNYLSRLGWTTTEDWALISLGQQSTLSEEARATLDSWQPVQVGQVFDEHFAAQGGVNFDPIYVPVRNLVGSIGEGSTILIGAHYDSRIFADHDPDEQNRTLPMPGANDGGSGVGVLLELARVISEHYTVNQEVRFVFFDAEDNGSMEPFISLLPTTRGYLIGSTLYANRLNLETEQIDYMLLVDLVGEFDQQFPIEGYSNQVAPDLAAAIWNTAADLGYAEQFPNEVRGAITDDHLPFIQRGIPAVDIIDLDYEYWHTSQDTMDKIDPHALERVGRVIEAYLAETGVITRNNES